MISNRIQQFSKLTGRQKGVAIALAIVLIFLIWQVKAMFSDGTPKTTLDPKMHAPAPTQMPMPQAAQVIPKVATEIKTSPREAELLKLQQATEAKYIAAINELQMLKVSREIAETNQAIMKAQLDTVTSQKTILDMLEKPATLPPTAYAPNLVQPIGIQPESSQNTSVQIPSTSNYVVISVSKLQNKWGAVMAYQDKLYNVSTGDILPADGSKVIAIDTSGVVIQKDGVTRKISMVPVI